MKPRASLRLRDASALLRKPDGYQFGRTVVAIRFGDTPASMETRLGTRQRARLQVKLSGPGGRWLRLPPLGLWALWGSPLFGLVSGGGVRPVMVLAEQPLGR